MTCSKLVVRGGDWWQVKRRERGRKGTKRRTGTQQQRKDLTTHSSLSLLFSLTVVRVDSRTVQTVLSDWKGVDQQRPVHPFQRRGLTAEPREGDPSPEDIAHPGFGQRW